MLRLFLFILTLLPLHSDMLITPEAAAKAHFGENVTVIKRSAMLSATQLERVEKEAKTPLGSKIVRLFECRRDAGKVATGILLVRKVRTKDAVVLYLFDANATLKAAEMIAFGEPGEYLPNERWFEQLGEAPETRPLRMGEDVSTITGATLSARAISDGARAARAVFRVLQP